MSYSFRAIATDYDGTLTEGGPPTPEVRAALSRARENGRKLILVTGRILNELISEFPEAPDLFDAIVAENGAVLHTGSGTRLLCQPLPPELGQALLRRGVPSRSGQVLIATTAVQAITIFNELGRLGLECELIRNRGELMVLPTGISKGTGLREALGELGVSHHSTLGIGDGENDHSLLETCEVGVAVANAVDSLRARADVLLSQRAGEGVASLLDGALVRGEIRAQPRRWRVALGECESGEVVEVPGSGVNVLIAGGSGAGKSFLAGLLAERLIRLGYSIVVIDPEGDHASLGRLRGVLLVGGEPALPLPSQLLSLVRHRFGSLVVDLSHLAPKKKAAYSREALVVLQRERADTGLPHWIFLDEAHDSVGVDGPASAAFDPSQKGYCLVTYHPEELCLKAREGIDFFFFPLGPRSAPRLAELLSVAGVHEMDPSWTRPEIERGHALRVASLGRMPELFRIGRRTGLHIRHWHKYVASQLPQRSRFVFRGPAGPTGAVAGNISEFHHEVLAAQDAVIAHHATEGDFARWTLDVLQDEDLATLVAQAEGLLPQGPGAVRVALLDAIERRYGDEARQPVARLR